MIQAFFVVGIAAVRSRCRIRNPSAIVAMIAVVVVVVTVVGVVVGAVVMVHVGMRTVVVAPKSPVPVTAAAPATMTSTVASASVAMGLNCGDIEAQRRQDNHPGH